MKANRTSFGQARAQAEAAAQGQPLPVAPFRRAPRQLESAQGMALIVWADLQVQMGRRPSLKHLRHIPNGGARDARTGGRLKAEGVRRGTWDYVLPVVTRDPIRDDTGYAAIRYPGLWIELKVESERKTARGGLSKMQEEFGEFIHEQGYATVVAYSWDEARAAIEAYLDGIKIPFFWAPKVSHETR
jgi:hypothetical protein